jgi:hypothetical protein
MDGQLFDRITRTLAGSTARRGALRGAVAASLTAVSTRLGIDRLDAKKKKKKRCRRRLQKCGGKKKCCKKNGPVSCQEVSGLFKPECESFAGRVCCGQDGAKCDRFKNGCDCCGDLRCFEEPDREFRCRLNPT